MDASTIDLRFSVVLWARFRATKGAAVKLHTILDLSGNIPVFIHISDGKLHDVNALDLLHPEPGAFCVMDLGYVDFRHLFTLEVEKAFLSAAPSPTRASSDASRGRSTSQRAGSATKRSN